jgi:hypothetical protein
VLLDRGGGHSGNMKRDAPDGKINWRRLLAVAAVVASAAAVCSPACAVEIFCSVCAERSMPHE